MNQKPTSLAQERISDKSWLPPWTLAEHEARYRFAAEYVRNNVVVDCACGNGVGSKVFLGRNPVRLYGFDTDSSAIEIASQRCRDNRASFECTSGTSLPLEPASCDLVISLETIEHIQNDAAFITEIARVVRPGGLFLCSTPNRLVTNPGALSSNSPWNPFHVREYAPSELRNLLRTHFDIVSEFGQNPVSRLRILVESWIGRTLHLRIPVRINQLWKCRWFLIPQGYMHGVQACSATHDYEYLVFVCLRRPET
jgi:SAM-dependent methyltransferase